MTFNPSCVYTVNTKVCVERNLFCDWGDMCNLTFIAATILNFELALPAWRQASLKFKIVEAMNAKLHISAQSEEKFLPTQSLVILPKRPKPSIVCLQVDTFRTLLLLLILMFMSCDNSSIAATENA